MLDIHKIDKKNWIVSNYKRIVYFLIITMCCVAKLFLCSVSIDGSQIHNEMTADYWNIAKSILNGKILYKDVVDHKGLYLYLFYVILVWLSNNHISIVAFAETIVLITTIGVFYQFVVKDGKDNLGNKIYQNALFPTAIFAIFYTIFSNEVTLLNTEGLALPIVFLVYGYAKNTTKIESKHFAIIGALLGVLFHFKITTISLFIPIYAFVCAKHLKNKGNFMQIVKSTMVGFATFVTVNVPFVIYLLKENVLVDFLTIYKHCLGKKENLDVFLIVLPFVLITFSIFCLYKEKALLSNVAMFLAIVSIYANFGTTCNYYLIFYIGMSFCLIVNNGQINKYLYFAVIIFSLIFGMKMIGKSKVYINQKEIATKYRITNESILYLWEDWGFGAYGNEPFTEPYQWVPSMFLYSNDFKEEYVELTKKRLQNKQFEYVFSFTKEGFRNVKEWAEEDESQFYLEVYLSLEDDLFNNYEPLEDAPFLYKAK